MATAIKLKNTRETFLNNVFITGFNKGVEAINSKLTLNKVNKSLNFCLIMKLGLILTEFVT